MVAPALLPALAPAFSAVAPFLPAGKALAGYLASTSNNGLFKTLEKKLDSYARKEEAMRELVRSRMHVVLHLRPMIPSVAIANTPAAQAPVPGWRRWLGAAKKEKCAVLDTVAKNCSGSMLGGLWCVPAKANEHKPPTSVVVAPMGTSDSMDLGEGAERHELVLAKVEGYIVVDYKGMMYRMLDRDGKPIPSGIKAFRINVLYDILRGAAQSGEFEADRAGRQQVVGGRPQDPPPQSIAPGQGPPPLETAPGSTSVSEARQESRGMHSYSAAAFSMGSGGDAMPVSGSPQQDAKALQDISIEYPVATGLSEAMEYTKQVRLRSEILCMRGKDVMFASYFDTDFTRENMLAGTKLHATGKEDPSNPYCRFVEENTTAILAQCEILSTADLKAVCATTGSSSFEGDEHHNSKISQCLQSFSRIKDVTGSVGSSMMPWFRRIVETSTPGGGGAASTNKLPS